MEGDYIEDEAVLGRYGLDSYVLYWQILRMAQISMKYHAMKKGLSDGCIWP